MSFVCAHPSFRWRRQCWWWRWSLPSDWCRFVVASLSFCSDYFSFFYLLWAASSEDDRKNDNRHAVFLERGEDEEESEGDDRTLIHGLLFCCVLFSLRSLIHQCFPFFFLLRVSASEDDRQQSRPVLLQRDESEEESDSDDRAIKRGWLKKETQWKQGKRKQEEKNPWKHVSTFLLSIHLLLWSFHLLLHPLSIIASLFLSLRPCSFSQGTFHHATASLLWLIAARVHFVRDCYWRVHNQEDDDLKAKYFHSISPLLFPFCVCVLFANRSARRSGFRYLGWSHSHPWFVFLVCLSAISFLSSYSSFSAFLCHAVILLAVSASEDDGEGTVAQYCCNKTKVGEKSEADDMMPDRGVYQRPPSLALFHLFIPLSRSFFCLFVCLFVVLCFLSLFRLHVSAFTFIFLFVYRFLLIHRGGRGRGRTRSRSSFCAPPAFGNASRRNGGKLRRWPPTKHASCWCVECLHLCGKERNRAQEGKKRDMKERPTWPVSLRVIVLVSVFLSFYCLTQSSCLLPCCLQHSMKPLPLPLLPRLPLLHLLLLLFPLHQPPPQPLPRVRLLFLFLLQLRHSALLQKEPSLMPRPLLLLVRAN